MENFSARSSFLAFSRLTFNKEFEVAKEFLDSDSETSLCKTACSEFNYRVA